MEHQISNNRLLHVNCTEFNQGYEEEEEERENNNGESTMHEINIRSYAFDDHT